MEGRFADGFVLIIGSVSVVVHGGEHVPVPVQHRAAGQNPRVVVQVSVEGRRGPTAPVNQKFSHEKEQSQPQRSRQKQAQHRPPFNFPHGGPPLRRLPGSGETPVW
ncbi:hypothetical protein SDC9_158165 [bioreactor metagenome]|uniref:Uncharacterized protein n=1 Tax=bioreactor metagenome TaxID=1076179 RepID=A0A645F925_9ZZZZ